MILSRKLKLYAKKTLLHYGIIDWLRKQSIDKLYIKGYSWPIYNINRDYGNPKQSKILLCYILEPLFNSSSSFFHANFIHSVQMISCLSKLGFCVDICNYYDSHSLLQTDYDYILGFGTSFKTSCVRNPNAKKILFLTENDPQIVRLKMNERILYLKERHPRFNFESIEYRIGIYDESMFDISDYGILMNSFFNCSTMSHLFKKTYQINVNAIVNKNYQFKRREFGVIKNHFVWFGSIGAIHKGLDLLIDVFSVLPELTLNIYGLRKEEIFFEVNLFSNIIVHEKVSVLSDAFLNEVVAGNAFCILPSCSEAMASGIATCMSHGLIPLITKETGYDKQDFIFEFDDYKIETISAKVIKLSNLENLILEKLSRSCYEYSRNAFSIESFSSKFESIMKDIINE